MLFIGILLSNFKNKEKNKKKRQIFWIDNISNCKCKDFRFRFVVVWEHFQEMKKPCKEKGDFLFTYIISQWKQQQQKQKQKTEKSIHEIGRVCMWKKTYMICLLIYFSSLFFQCCCCCCKWFVFLVSMETLEKKLLESFQLWSMLEQKKTKANNLFVPEKKIQPIVYVNGN